MSTQAVLFDAPGPKARLRHRVLTVVGAILALGIAYIVFLQFQKAGQLKAFMWEPFVTDPEVWTSYLIPGLKGTFTAAGISIVLAVVFGLLFGMGRLSPFAPLRWFCSVIVEFFRAVPVLLMMVFAYFGYFATSDLVPNQHAPLAAVVTALTLYNGAVIAELVRSGVHGLPKGQSEAGLSVGLTSGQVLRSIQLPQALTAMLPALVGQLVVVLKDSALGYGITYLELLNWSKTLGSAYANTVPAYIVAGILFIVINYSLTKLAVYLEGRMKKRRARA
ncbi:MULTISPECIES: amino acid ABC transporter permease [Dietzia]|uniref:Amino acid ABC transporter membrane protein 2 (PAAT family) n=1 Tax=Dietzia cinnamea TaxID=321318 RepID=A0A4R3ZXZ3_9ACTN|nr:MULTISPECIES: amino acid ABC transporter permease [Dietzia]KZO59235.1 amino acid ABC transporter permease [Dietzia maris]MCT1641621.1 amino acid ABC transporter permease [Dietzia cinnamea]MCT2100174.1 amino acid ABC transporter permease [Dietzia cinnamea]MCT2122654.1 amino acid ABC transporter permease [Dietzia cinnamea]MCT2141318.1 amino acid ABC transporter permease [Dietzia cinnamea]